MANSLFDGTVEQPSRWQRFRESHLFHSFKTDRIAQVSLILFTLYVLVALLAPLISPFNPYDPSTIDIMDSELPPVWQDGADGRLRAGDTADEGDQAVREALRNELFVLERVVLVPEDLLDLLVHHERGQQGVEVSKEGQVQGEGQRQPEHVEVGL